MRAKKLTADALADTDAALLDLETKTGLWIDLASDSAVVGQGQIDAITAEFQVGYPACEAPAGDDHSGCAEQSDKDACDAADSTASGKKCTWVSRRPRVFGDAAKPGESRQPPNGSATGLHREAHIWKQGDLSVLNANRQRTGG